MILARFNGPESGKNTLQAALALGYSVPLTVSGTDFAPPRPAPPRLTPLGAVGMFGPCHLAGEMTSSGVPIPLAADVKPVTLNFFSTSERSEEHTSELQ